MGLDTDYDCFHGAYGSFGRFRDELAKVAGYGDYPEQFLKDGLFTKAHLDGYWEEEPDDVLKILLCHQDCEGWLFPNYHEQLADRLIELAPKLSDESMRRATQFAAGLKAAFNEWAVVGFH